MSPKGTWLHLVVEWTKIYMRAQAQSISSWFAWLNVVEPMLQASTPIPCEVSHENQQRMKTWKFWKWAISSVRNMWDHRWGDSKTLKPNFEVNRPLILPTIRKVWSLRLWYFGAIDTCPQPTMSPHPPMVVGHNPTSTLTTTLELVINGISAPLSLAIPFPPCCSLAQISNGDPFDDCFSSSVDTAEAFELISSTEASD